MVDDSINRKAEKRSKGNLDQVNQGRKQKVAENQKGKKTSNNAHRNYEMYSNSRSGSDSRPRKSNAPVEYHN